MDPEIKVWTVLWNPQKFKRLAIGQVRNLFAKQHTRWMRTLHSPKCCQCFSQLHSVAWEQRCRSSPQKPLDMAGVEPKIRGWNTPKMDGENNGKPQQNSWFGGTPVFGNTHMQVFNGFTAPQKGQPNEILKSPHGWGSRKLGSECCLFCPRKKGRKKIRILK